MAGWSQDGLEDILVYRVLDMKLDVCDALLNQETLVAGAQNALIARARVQGGKENARVVCASGAKLITHSTQTQCVRE